MSRGQVSVVIGLHRAISIKSTCRDQLHAVLSERLAAMEQRRKRMQHIRSRLTKLEHAKVDKTYRDAVSRLRQASIHMPTQLS